MIMDTTSTGNVAQQQSPAYALMKRGKRGAAAIIAAECCNVAAATAAASAAQQSQQDDGGTDAVAAASALARCKLLDNMLDVLLNPYDAIGEWNNIDWLRWLMAGGKTLDEFSSAVKDYDYGTCCGLVWTANYVAYRCRTCSISPCMSLCGECFKRGDHTGHDFNMFRSQAGGACDCGDTSVMKPDGFCRKHSSTNNIDGSSSSSSSGCKQPPADLLRVAERIMPRLLLRLVQYLRENSKLADSRTGNAPGGVASGAGISSQQQNLLFLDLDPFLGMLHDLSALGAAMRRVMTVSLTNEKIYRWACDYYSSTGNIVGNDSSQQQQQQQQIQQTIYTIYTDKVRRYYAEAINQYTTSSTSSSSARRRRHSNTTSVGSGEVIISINNSLSNSEDEDDDDDFGQDGWITDGQNSSGRKNKLNHSSFLQEIVFWTVRYEFPQKMVCLLLNMLPDAAYKEALTEAFVMHYGCVARVLATTRDSDTLSNHIVHISVQLFSNEALATRMVDKLGLLRVMVSSLRRMMTKILIPSLLHDPTKNRHRVVDCSKAVMKEHCYWPLVSDLNNVLSHRPIAVKFMCDDRLLDSWFSYLSMFQGMNINCQEMGHHVEFEPNTYYAAFSAELEASAYPMWAMLSHLTSSDTWPLASRVLRACLHRLRKWLIDVGFYNNENQKSSICAGNASSSTNYNTTARIISIMARQSEDRHQFTFHLPLHRYLAVFLCQAVRAQGARVEDVLPRSNTGDTSDRDALLLAIATHPVRAQSAFYEIMQGTWVRNGLQIKGQAMTYIQSNFCISMVDADIYLLQLCLSELSDANIFMSLILEKFKVNDWMRINKQGGLPQVMDSMEYDAAPTMESLLVFLATLVGVRTNLCSDEDYDYCQSQLEMVTLLCVSDKTHSQLMELMPERCGGSGPQATTATTTSTSGDHASENIHSLDQESPSSPRDFETVLQAVAEYKRPQFEASGNMQQGLYVPLAHVWRNLYDPVHVLLRAVHRRDFQSSMDRYTAFMRSIGLLSQNQTPWPPYRTPQQHHPAYRDPRRALLSRLFHTVAWHCLYRSAVYRDVSEHTLSLLVYLLDQAWICYNNSSTASGSETTSNQQEQHMDTDPPTDNFLSSASSSGQYFHETSRVDSDVIIFPKKQIKLYAETDSYFCHNDIEPGTDPTLLLLDNWYDHDDLVNNLCTTITHVELPPPLFHYYFNTTSDDANNSTNTTAASTMATNLFDYFTSSVAAAAAAASSSTTMSVPETVNSHQQQSNVPSLAAIAGNEIPIVATRSSQSTTSATRPPFYSLNAAAAATSSTMADSALNRVKQRLQFLRPPLPKMTTPLHLHQQLSSSSSEQQVTTDMDTTTNHIPSVGDTSNDDMTTLINDDGQILMPQTNYEEDGQNSLVSINESIISLLLRLHSQLSGKPDSYQPPSPTSTSNTSDLLDGSTTKNDHLMKEMPPCGDGAYYVGRLLDKIASKSMSCHECVVRTRLALWPRAVVMRETATREDEERERRERKRRARDKQQQMMEEMARAQRAFLESARRSGDLDSTDTQLPMQSQSTTNTATNITTHMECDEPVAPTDASTATTSSNEASTSSLLNVAIDIDENSSSSNSTSTTTKESAVGVRGAHHQETTQTVDCVICNQTVVVNLEQQRCDPVGLVILVQGSNLLAHRRHILPPSTATKKQYNIDNNSTDGTSQQQQPTELATGSNSDNTNNYEINCIEEDEQNYYRYWPALPPLQPQPQNQQSTSVIDDVQQNQQSLVTTIIDDYDTTTYASHSDRRKHLIMEYFNNIDTADLEIGALTTTTSATPIGGNVHVQTCGHHLHLRCWSSYLASLRGAQRFNSDRGEYSCPLCRQLANSLMPIIPEVGIHKHQIKHPSDTSSTSNTINSMSDYVNELTELIKQQESVLIKPVTSRSNICSGDSPSSVIGSNDNQQIIHQHQEPQLSRHFPGGYLPDHMHNDSIGEGDGIDEKEEDIENGEDPLLDAVNRCVSDMITTTVVTAAAHTIPLPPSLLTAAQLEKMYKVRWHSAVSVAWTNIQVELVQRNNSLIEQHQQKWSSSLFRSNYCHHLQKSTAASSSVVADMSGSNNYYNMLPKRNCIAPLLKVLRESARSLVSKHQTNNPLNDIWFKLIGVEQPQQQLTNILPPLLMRDPCSTLLQLLLLLPNLECGLFDTLVKLTYNMQLYAAALKIAVSWNHNYNRSQSYHRHHDRCKPNKTSVITEGTLTIDSCSQMDLDDGNNDVLPLSSLMDITEGENMLPSYSPLKTPLFSQVVALAKKVVILSQDFDDVVDDKDESIKHHDEEDNVEDDRGDLSIANSGDNEENILMLESYGRRCTLPFLRFAALLKKYTNGDDSDNLNDHHELTTILSSPQQSNLNMEQPKQKEQLLDSQFHHGKHSPLREVNYKKDSLIKCSYNSRCHWSQDDFEFLMLARYLKLLKTDDETYEDCDCCVDNYDSNENENKNKNKSQIKQRKLKQPPSAMDAVNWPQWSYSSTDNSDKVATTISRTWLIAFREALTTKFPKSVILCEKNTTIVSSAAAEIDPNSKATTSANIVMAARRLLAIDCCDGGGAIKIHRTSGISRSGCNLLPIISWTGPRLLKLPHLYDDVFQYYHGRACHRCHGVPRETSVCLVCGTVVCLKENCCKTNGIYEAVQHSLECGGGTGMFLVVTSSSVVVIRGKRACLWGSVYLDAFGEEDRELKRGKPLYLSAERYRLLERQWLAHRFDHTNKKWVWHRDAL